MIGYVLKFSVDQFQLFSFVAGTYEGFHDKSRYTPLLKN